MRRALATSVIAGLAVVGLAVSGLAVAQPAWAAPTTQVVQGDVLRLVSVADWDAAASMRPGEPVQWDVAVSADAPDPGTVSIGVSATGDAVLIVDASVCLQEWTASGCPGGESVLRSDWDIPRDGVEAALTSMSDTQTAHLRLTIALAAGGDGETDVRVHAAGAGESVVIGGDGGLATTGMSPVVYWVLGGGLAALLIGVVLLLSRRRASRDEEDEP